MRLDEMNDRLIKSMFETIPYELTVIDANDKVVGWNKHNKRLFHRPEACIGMDFRECHPKTSLDLVEKIVTEMKEGKRDKARFWINLPVDPAKKEIHKIVIEFYALRDDNNIYLGCMECTADIEDLLHLEGEKRLMDE
jgi:DUF438 domain-containing protein